MNICEKLQRQCCFVVWYATRPVEPRQPMLARLGISYVSTEASIRSVKCGRRDINSGATCVFTFFLVWQLKIVTILAAKPVSGFRLGLFLCASQASRIPHDCANIPRMNETAHTRRNKKVAGVCFGSRSKPVLASVMLAVSWCRIFTVGQSHLRSLRQSLLKWVRLCLEGTSWFYHMHTQMKL